MLHVIFFFQAEDGIRDIGVTGVQTCALPISSQNFDFLREELQNSVETRILEGFIELTSRARESKVQYKKLAMWLNISPSIVRRHLDRLRIGLILDENGPFSNPYYSFKIELVRNWLTRNRWFFSQ